MSADPTFDSLLPVLAGLREQGRPAPARPTSAGASGDRTGSGLRPTRRAFLLGGGAALLAAAAGLHQLRAPAGEAVQVADAYARGLTLRGWPVLTVEDTVLVAAAGRQFRLRPGPTAVVLADFITRFDATVEQIAGGDLDDWSYARRSVRGTQLVWSEHAAGTAVDLNALAHPQGRAGTFSARGRKALGRLLDRYDGVVGWGGRFDRPDEMHVEIAVRPGSTTLAAVAARIADR